MIIRFVTSTANVLGFVIDCDYRALDKNGAGRVLAFDILKAFDRALHARLLYNLKGYDVTIRISDLIQSSLTNRIMHNSRSFHINAGYQQALSLFFIFINELHDVISSHLVIYTNRITIYRRVGEIKLVAALKNEIQ